jgi:DNA-binding response OmpR family regulator
MTFANAAELVRLLLRQSDRHPIRAVGAADLKLYEPGFVRSLRNRGILVEREDLRDDGAAVFQVIDDGLVIVDPETGECERYEDALDVQTFDIDIAALCRAIREQSGLGGPGPTALSIRVWRLGRHEGHNRAAEVCLVRRLREDTAQEIVDHVRGAIDDEAPVALISLGSCDLPTTVARQLEALRMTVVRAEDLLRDDPALPFALDLGRIRVPTGPQASDARLQIDRIGRRVIFEGIELDVEPRDFDAFVMLAEEAVAAGGWVPKDSLAATLQASTGRESNPEQVDRCLNRLRDVFRKNTRLNAVPSNGFIERKSKVGARLAFASSEIAFIA